MKNILYIFGSAWLVILGALPIQAQNRYATEIFTEVQVQKDLVYGQNISILTGMPAPIDLLADVYSPVGDSLTERPVILVAHTGSFLPPLINGTTAGDRGDSTLVEVCHRLAKRGFVAVAYTYRLGWQPLGTRDVRIGSLLQAAYRAIQDTRTAVRFLKKSVVEDGNPLGIDMNKIAIWGIGTGGYLSAGAATLDDYEEVILDKFLDGNLNPLADTALLGNFYATDQAPLCIPNHTGYSSDFQLAINMGGALGDLSWLDGDDHEPPMVGVHCPTDIFAPYYIGNVVVPKTGDLVIEEAAGTRGFIAEANRLGLNDIFRSLTPDQDPLQGRIQAQKMALYKTEGGNIPLGADNMYAFIRPFPEGSPWDWWNDNIIRAKVIFLNEQGFMLDADAILSDSYATNSDMSAEKARRYIDTVFHLVIPRICVALSLPCNLTINQIELSPQQTGLAVGPIPARDLIEIRTHGTYPMQSIQVYDMNGRLVQGHTDVDTDYFRMDPSPLAPGNYILRIQFENGFANARIAIQ